MTVATEQKIRFLDPKNDIAFKKIFGNEDHHEALVEFLNSVLLLSEPIESVTLRNPYQPPLIKGLKGTILDIYATTAHHQFIVEMQVENENAFAKRMFYYACKAYYSQIQSGEDYSQLKPVIFLGVLDFTRFKRDTDRYIRRHRFLDIDDFTHDFSEFDFNLIELPKFNKTESELKTATDKWLFFLKNASMYKEIPSWADSVGLQRAYSIAEKHNWTQEELDLYDYWKKREWTHLHAVDEAREEGKAEGKAEGAKAIALELLKLGLDTKKISEATKLSPEEIEKLK